MKSALLKYDAAYGYVDTCESYSDYLLMGNGHVVIPYVNADLMKGNPVRVERQVVDYSYYVFLGVRELISHQAIDNWSSRKTIEELIEEYVMVGGRSNKKGSATEIRVACKGLELWVRVDANFRDYSTPYVPYNRDEDIAPRWRMNMDVNEVDEFFAIDKLPIEIKDLLGNNFTTVYL